MNVFWLLMGCTEELKEEVNEPPSFTGIEISPAEGISTSSELVCVATATDPNGDPLSLSIEWTNAEGAVLSEDEVLVLSVGLERRMFYRRNPLRI